MVFFYAIKQVFLKEVFEIKRDITEEILSAAYIPYNLKYYDNVMRETPGMYGRECSLDFIKKKQEKLLKLKKKVKSNYHSKIDKLDLYLKVLEESIIDESDHVELVTFKLYLQLENVVKVTRTVNDLGFRIKTSTYSKERRYTTNDITSIITDSFANVDEDLKMLVQERQRKNYYGNKECF
ncbi:MULTISPECIES: hypothetical protein [unclassified Clostridioides]|uniref:hypothetical protein n=1 Tax=unclassified Clostridioides TaxID=2635829 RepID=UPI001D0C05FF|nr:hypothetical protein [Clostridioides sp. ES-S-0001-02]MCC0642134.1 hypothetical protein [Clostridioides sp. ES-S-0049-03]MCC0678122.1 hypothetical protein [Clostridioides sp. ES-W-0018-02]MCC0712902.1 hypothetical protein [Clostridioides sp. ES-W-0017-02]MCC0764986.1 hypothetical protein [Clostridioides sp. ES-S-0006-03]